MKFVFVCGTTPSTKYDLPEHSAVEVGRGDGCAVPIIERSVSRKHAILGVKNDGLLRCAFLEDLGSKFGTWIGENRVPPNTQMVIKQGDIVRFGSAPSNCFRLFAIPRTAAVSGLSHLSGKDRSHLMSVLRNLGITVRKSFCNGEIDILIIQNLALTTKVFCALCRNIPIVNPDYFSEFEIAFNRGSVVPSYKNFCPKQNENSKENYSLAMKTMPGRAAIFQDKVLCFSSKEQESRYAEVVIAGGGRTTSVATCPKEDFARAIVVAAGGGYGLDERGPDGRRQVHEVEIGLAVLHCSVDVFCNPLAPVPAEVRHHLRAASQKMESQSQSAALVPSGQRPNDNNVPLREETRCKRSCPIILSSEVEPRTRCESYSESSLASSAALSEESLCVSPRRANSAQKSSVDDCPVASGHVSSETKDISSKHGEKRSFNDICAKSAYSEMDASDSNLNYFAEQPTKRSRHDDTKPQISSSYLEPGVESNNNESVPELHLTRATKPNLDSIHARHDVRTEESVAEVIIEVQSLVKKKMTQRMVNTSSGKRSIKRFRKQRIGDQGDSKARPCVIGGSDLVAYDVTAKQRFDATVVDLQTQRVLTNPSLMQENMFH